MLAIPRFGASSNIALMRANTKPPVELVVDDLEVLKNGDGLISTSVDIKRRSKDMKFIWRFRKIQDMFEI